MGKQSKHLHKKMWSIHNWVGLYAGVVIAILSLTGVVALFKAEIDRLVNSDYYFVQSSEIKDKRADITPVIDSLKNIYGKERVNFVIAPTNPKENWIIQIPVRKSTLDYKAWEFFVNPYTGKIVGKRDLFSSIGYFIRSIHVRFYEGFFGRYFVGIAGIALLISTITGFWIYGGFMKKQLFATIRKKNLRVTMADYHKLIGVTTLIFNLVIAITGAWLGLQGLLQKPIIGDRPGIYATKELKFTEEEDAELSVDYLKVYEASRKQWPELEPKYFQSSTDGKGVVTVRGTVPRTAFERHHFQLTLDKQTLQEVHRLDIRNLGIGAKIFYIQESMHFGDWGGLLLKLVYAFFGVTSGFLALTGFVVYLKRTENKRKEKPKFIELKPLFLRWTFGILGGILVLLLLSLSFGVVVPSVLVILSVYGSLIFLLIRALVLFLKHKINSRRFKTT